MSRPVATLVAIMQKASCGVRILIACQLRFRTSTIDLFSMSFIVFTDSDVLRAQRCLSFIEMEVAAAAGNAPAHPLSETDVRLSHSAAKMVARVGTSPTSAVCKTAALILS